MKIVRITIQDVDGADRCVIHAHCNDKNFSLKVENIQSLLLNSLGCYRTGAKNLPHVWFEKVVAFSQKGDVTDTFPSGPPA